MAKRDILSDLLQTCELSHLVAQQIHVNLLCHSQCTLAPHDPTSCPTHHTMLGTPSFARLHSSQPWKFSVSSWIWSARLCLPTKCFLFSGHPITPILAHLGEFCNTLYLQTCFWDHPNFFQHYDFSIACYVALWLPADIPNISESLGISWIVKAEARSTWTMC